MLITLIYLTFINLIGAKTVEIICKKYYTADSERSCFEIINNVGIENLKFFNLNPSIDCSNVIKNTVCIDGIYENNINLNNEFDYKAILVNSTLNDIFNFYGKKSYSKFNKIYELVDSLIINENEKFNYNQCVNNCENGQSYYEKILNDHNNPYNIKTIKEINTYYGLTTDTLIKDPYNSCVNFCKSVQLLERKEVENDKKNEYIQEKGNNSTIQENDKKNEYIQEKGNNSTIQEVNIDKRGEINKAAISSNYQEPYLQYLRSYYGPDSTTVLYREYEVITRVKQSYRRDKSVTFEDGRNHPFLYRVYQIVDGCSYDFLRANEKEVRNVVDAVCNRHDVCYFCENSKDKCDDLLLDGIYQTCQAYENRNMKLFDQCRHEYNLIKFGIYVGNSFFKESYKDARDGRIKQERSKLFGHLICSSNNKKILLNNNFKIKFNEYEDGKIYSSSDRCGEKFGICKSGYCCSQYGYCGKTTEYCGYGCNPLYGDCKYEGVGGECGPNYGSCPKGCCSQYGYCGTTSEYCGKGCQKEYGRCN